MFIVPRDDQDVRRDLRPFGGNRIAVALNVFYGIQITRSSLWLTSDYQRLRRADKRQRILSDLALEISTVNRLPIPLIRIQNEPTPDGQTADQDGESRTWFLYGLYTEASGLIEIWNLDAEDERPRRARCVFNTFCHEMAHHLDHCIWGCTEHTEAFYTRVQNIERALYGAHRRWV